MLNIVRYTAEKKESWNLFIKNAKNGLFMHDRNFMDYHSDRFIDNSLMFYNDSELLCVIPLSRHGNELRSHGGLTYGGFIVNNKMKQHHMDDCFSLLIDYMRKNNINRLLYKKIPYIFYKEPSDEDLYSLYKVGARLKKIEASTAIRLDYPIKMTKGRKAQISRGKKEGVIVERSFDFKSFLKLENSVLEKHFVKAVHSIEELEKLQNSFKDEIQLWVSRYHEEIIAASLLFIYDNTVHTQYMAANEISRKIGGLDLLISILINKFSQKKFFDFGISTEDDGKYLNTGLISQKESFGGRTVAYQSFEILV